MHAELSDLLRRARAGCPDAARLLVERYSTPLRRAVEQRLLYRLRSTHDPDDVLQSAWKDFFSHSLAEHQFDTPERLIRFLLGVCRNKVLLLHRRQLDTLKRTRKRQEKLPADLAAKQPGPELIAEADDRFEALLAGLPPRWRVGMTMLRDGHSHREAAEAVGVCERTLARFLVHARRAL